MIAKNIEETAAITALNKTISVVRYGAVLVWQAIRSCFGKGYWVNDKPWRNEDGWKNNV